MNFSKVPIEQRYEAALSGVKKYEGKINSKLVHQLKKTDPVLNFSRTLDEALQSIFSSI